ncbi:Endoglucanase 3 [Hordeum vulgare]|nr:Endoglucanase 3 [Hordeum vulgare]
MCSQMADEPLRDYLTRWTELCNSCEGVHEMQAIQYFIEGCRDGTVLKHKLMSSEEATLAELKAKADKYAKADSAMRIKVTATGKDAPPLATPRLCVKSRGQENNKRKTDRPDPRYGSTLVATTKEEQSATQAASERQRADKGTS